jgi:hypothetical protein
MADLRLRGIRSSEIMFSPATLRYWVSGYNETFHSNKVELGFKMIHKQYTSYSIDPQKGTVCPINLSLSIQGF